MSIHREGLPPRPVNAMGAHGFPVACIEVHKRLELLENLVQQLQAEIRELREVISPNS